jgi:hypothetical protein
MTMKKIIQHEDYYLTSDLALTTTLSIFFPIEAIDKKNPYKAQFSFKQSKDLERIIKNYWDGKLKIEPKMFFNQLKIIKSRLYGEL